MSNKRFYYFISFCFSTRAFSCCIRLSSSLFLVATSSFVSYLCSRNHLDILWNWKYYKLPVSAHHVKSWSAERRERDCCFGVVEEPKKTKHFFIAGLQSVRTYIVCMSLSIWAIGSIEQMSKNYAQLFTFLSYVVLSMHLPTLLVGCTCSRKTQQVLDNQFTTSNAERIKFHMIHFIVINVDAIRMFV